MSGVNEEDVQEKSSILLDTSESLSQQVDISVSAQEVSSLSVHSEVVGSQNGLGTSDNDFSQALSRFSSQCSKQGGSSGLEESCESVSKDCTDINTATSQDTESGPCQLSAEGTNNSDTLHSEAKSLLSHISSTKFESTPVESRVLDISDNNQLVMHNQTDTNCSQILDSEVSVKDVLDSNDEMSADDIVPNKEVVDTFSCESASNVYSCKNDSSLSDVNIDSMHNKDIVQTSHVHSTDVIDGESHTSNITEATDHTSHVTEATDHTPDVTVNRGHTDVVMEHCTEPTVTTKATQQMFSQDLCEIKGHDSDVNKTMDMTETGMSECPEPITYTDLRYTLSTTCIPEFLTEARSEYQGAADNFLRGCKWSSDGSSLVANSNDNRLRLYNMNGNMTNDTMAPSLTMKEGSPIYDFAWVPETSPTQGPHRIACTCAGIPIHLWNCHTGKIDASYRAYDQCDEITAAYSLGFSTDGRKLYAGYEKVIRTFDTEYPVRSCRTIKTFDKRRKEGQTGIISCFAISPDNNGLYVAGSYSRHIGIYDEACDRLVCMMQGQRGGVTHLMFSPDATKLYSGGRKDAEILCWDMRNTGKILFSVLRDVRTNQRMYFDVSQSGRYLTSGNCDGSVTFWDVFVPGEEVNGEVFLKPCSQYQAHNDCVNGVSFNHQYGILATASGQRHFENFSNYVSDDDSDQDMETDDGDTPDFSLKLWTIPQAGQ